MRLIDADALTDDMWVVEYKPYDGCDTRQTDDIVASTIKQCKSIVKDAPTVDAVPVVRCKDCKWFLQPGQYTKEPFGLCYIRGAMAVTANDYCSRGERKTE